MLAYAATEGLVVRAHARHVAAGTELIWAYGGVNGNCSARDGRVSNIFAPGKYVSPRSPGVSLALPSQGANFMQSRMDKGELVVTYTDGTSARLALRNPETWWPIEQDYFIYAYRFPLDAPLPPRVDLKTGTIRLLDLTTFKGKGREIPSGAATVLDLPLDPTEQLQSLTVRALTNDVVIGLMSATLESPL